MAVAAITTAAAGRSTTTAAAVAKKLACLSEQVGAARKFLRAARSSCNRQLQSIMARTRFKGEEALACRGPGAPAAECSIKVFMRREAEAFRLSTKWQMPLY